VTIPHRPGDQVHDRIGDALKPASAQRPPFGLGDLLRGHATFQRVLVLKRRIEDSAVGFRQLLELLAEQTQRSQAPIPIAIETAKGLLPAALLAAGYQLFPINPLAVSRYRDRYVVSRAKSDPGDALALANILRTDRAECGHLIWPRLVRFSSSVLAPPSGVVAAGGGVSSPVLAPPLSE
jgi:Transposase